MYTKFQIALQYFPDSIDAPNNAVQRLRRAILRNRALLTELRKIGYNAKSKVFTSRELALIYEYLGEP